MKILRAVGRFFKKLGYNIAKFFVLTFRELKRVRWPNKAKMKESATIVLTFFVLFGLYIVLDDFIIARLLKWIKY